MSSRPPVKRLKGSVLCFSEASLSRYIESTPRTTAVSMGMGYDTIRYDSREFNVDSKAEYTA